MHKPVTLKDLEEAALAVAEVMQLDGGEAFAPIFARLEAEMRKLQEDQNAIDNARAFLAAHQRS